MPHDLNRFIAAQNPVYDEVVRELQAGKKTSHWMWFIFPQLAALGHSETARYFGIVSRDEAKAYLEHPILGARLIECTMLVNARADVALVDMLGSVDALKFRSCMTLFSVVAQSTDVFMTAIRTRCAGQPDPMTLRLLEEDPGIPSESA